MNLTQQPPSADFCDLGLPLHARKLYRRYSRLLPVVYATAVASFISPLQAQEVSETKAETEERKEEEVIQLSTFVVDATRDTGYQASNTLSGTRVRSNLRDLAAAIQVVTKQMLEDTGSSNMTDILVYTTGTEVSGQGGNFANTRTNAEGAVNERANFRQPNTRVRGVAGADLTREYFPTSVPFDAYNTDRVEINRGANSALFGLGSPAGIINTSLSQAQLRNFGNVALQYGSFGSKRASVDINQKITNDIALRFAAVYDHKLYKQQPAFGESHREYLSGLWEPKFLQRRGILTGVTVRASYEFGRTDSNSPRTITPTENISRYFQVGKPTWDPPTSDLTTADRNIFGHNLTFTLGTFWPDPSSAVPGQGSVGIPNPSRPPSASTGQPIIATYGAITRLSAYLGRVNGDPFIVNPGLSREDVFDYRNYMIDGPNKSEFRQFGVFNTTVDVRLLNDKAGLQGAYSHENNKTGMVDWFQGQSFDGEIYVDYNVRLFNGAQNPNYGRPYILSRGSTDFGRVDRQGKRATAFYKWLAKDSLGETWGDWIGTHTFTASVSEQRTWNSFSNGYTYVSDSGRYSAYQGGYSATDPNTGVSPIVAYLGPSVAGLNSLSEVRLSPITVEMRPDLLTSAQSRFIVWNPATARWENQSVRVFRQEPESMMFVNGGSPIVTSDKIKSQVAVLQSSILKDHVVFTGSWRADRVKSYQVPNPNPTLTADTETTGYGFVTKVPRALTKHIPGVSYLGFLYNSSTNFQPSTIRRNAYFEPIASPSGDNRDIGFILEMFDGKLSQRVTWYDTKQVNVSAGMSLVQGRVAIMEAGVLSNIRNGVSAVRLQTSVPGITQAEVDRQVAAWVAKPWPFADRYFVDPNPPAGQSIQARSGNEDTYDLASKGVELETVYNPLPNWRIALNVAKQQALQSNTGVSTLRFIEERMALWTDAKDLPTTLAYGNTVGMDTYSQILSQYYRIANRDGTLLPEIREWRFNALTNYSFKKGALKGFGVGGAYRWEDRGGVGYQTFFDPALKIWRINPDKVWYSSARDNVDGWVSYQRKILGGKVLWKAQLNIRNLMDNDDLVVAYRNPDGTPAIFKIPEGRVWQLSSRFEF